MDIYNQDLETLINKGLELSNKYKSQYYVNDVLHRYIFYKKKESKIEFIDMIKYVLNNHKDYFNKLMEMIGTYKLNNTDLILYHAIYLEKSGHNQ